MNTALNIGGTDYVADHEARTVTPVDEVSERLSSALILLKNTLVGPQVDDMRGLRGGWADGPMAVIFVAEKVAQAKGLSFSFGSVDTTER